MEKPNLYNDLHPETSLKNTGFKNALMAFNTIKNVSKRSLKYQFDVINTMYNRAKFHPHQTTDMQQAMKIFLSWLSKYKKKKEFENKKYPWLSYDVVKKYKNIAKLYNLSNNDFLKIYKKFSDKPYKLQYILINYEYDYWSFRIAFIKKMLNKMKNSNTPLYYKTGKYKDLPTKQHLMLILYAYSPDNKFYNNL